MRIPTLTEIQQIQPKQSWIPTGPDYCSVVPLDILKYIFSYLPVASVGALDQVSKKYRAMLGDKVWSVLYARDFPHVKLEVGLKDIKSEYKISYQFLKGYFSFYNFETIKFWPSFPPIGVDARNRTFIASYVLNDNFQRVPTLKPILCFIDSKNGQIFVHLNTLDGDEYALLDADMNTLVQLSHENDIKSYEVVGKQLYTGDQVGDVLIWNGEGKAIKKFRTLPKSKSIQNIFSIQLDEKPHLLMSVEVDNAGRLSSHIFCCNLQGKEVLWEKLENKPIIYLAKFNEHTIVCVYADRPNIALIISKEGVTSLSHKNEIRNLCTDNGLIFTSTEEGIMIWRDSGSCLNVIRKTLFKMHVANLKIYVGSLNIGQVSVLDFSKSLKHSIQQLTTNFSNEVFLAYPQDVKNSIYKIYFYVRNMQGAVNDPLNTGKILFHMSDSLEGELGQIKKQAIQCYLWLSELEKKIQQGDGPGAKEIYDKLPEKLREAEFV